MYTTEQLKKEMKAKPVGGFSPDFFRAIGYETGTHPSPSGKRADGIAALLTKPTPFIYQNDLIVGSMRPVFAELTEEERSKTHAAVSPYPERTFTTNSDHYAPDYETVLRVGVVGLLEQINASEREHQNEPERLDFLSSMRVTLRALLQRFLTYASCAQDLIGTVGYDTDRLNFVQKNCRQLAEGAPQTFAQGLQLVWMIHSCFVSEGRYAMALGRLDQYLYPLYRKDMKSGILTKEFAIELLENAFVKIYERRAYLGVDDVVNICIGGVDSNGTCAINDLSYCILQAVGNVKLPGPNLSARITPDTPDEFLDASLKVIGTGLGYPALMNDTVNMAALRRYGYDEKDIRNYSMVGCIENFITGMQPPWSDGRFDTPRFLEYLFHDGVGYDSRKQGLHTGPVSEITSMEELMNKLEKQLDHGVAEYIEKFQKRNVVEHPAHYTSPFLSCFCHDCIERGLDINMGGSKYPSVHGVALMGVGTMSDSLAAIEKVVFCDREATLTELSDALQNNFEGYGALRERLLAAPKYGNNDPFVDRYAVWFTSYLSDRFDLYRTHDGGGIYTAMAANTSNIDTGKKIGATPDGRLAGEPLSDAASPTYGRDVRGATSTLLSASKPDYTRCACGTVLNQKFSPSMFADGKRNKLLNLIKVYFSKGGQEIQINATSTEVLKDAMKHPERYPDLVVRVSGFSALYVTLNRDVQEDILRRTQQE